MAEPTLLRSTLATGFTCPNCKGVLGRLDAVANETSDGDELRTSVEVRCPACHSTLVWLEFGQPAPDNRGDDYE